MDVFYEMFSATVDFEVVVKSEIVRLLCFRSLPSYFFATFLGISDQGTVSSLHG